MSTDRRVEFLSKFSQLVDTAYGKHGIQVAIFWLHRTPEQQQALYAQGRTQPGKRVTNCDGITKKSNHQRWEAADVCVIYAGSEWQWGRVPEYETLGRIAKELGLKWGGTFEGLNDIFHFELP